MSFKTIFSIAALAGLATASPLPASAPLAEAQTGHASRVRRAANYGAFGDFTSAYMCLVMNQCGGLPKPSTPAYQAPPPPAYAPATSSKKTKTKTSTTTKKMTSVQPYKTTSAAKKTSSKTKKVSTTTKKFSTTNKPPVTPPAYKAETPSVKYTCVAAETTTLIKTVTIVVPPTATASTAVVTPTTQVLIVSTTPSAAATTSIPPAPVGPSSTCGVKGWDKQTPAAFWTDGSGQYATSESCGGLCASKGAISYGAGGSMCLCYSASIKDNITPDATSPYAFWDVSCGGFTVVTTTTSSSSSSTATTMKTTTPCATTTSTLEAYVVPTTTSTLEAYDVPTTTPALEAYVVPTTTSSSVPDSYATTPSVPEAYVTPSPSTMQTTTSASPTTTTATTPDMGAYIAHLSPPEAYSE